jgi:hypothetical protein
MTQVNNPPPRDPRVAFHESLFGPESEDALPLSEEAVTAELRSLGRILEPVSGEQRQQLDMIAGLKPTKKKKRGRK